MDGKEPFNGVAVYRALVLCRRDSGLTPGDKLVMLAIARHMAVTTLPGTLVIADTAFPSVAQVADVAGLTERAVRKSLARLVPRYFTTSVIPGRMLRGRKDARWDGKRYHLTAVWSEIPSPYGNGDARGRAASPPKEAPAQPGRDVEGALHTLICETFPDDPTVCGPNPEKELANACRVMRDTSGGDLQTVQAILQHWRDVVRRNADHIGKYLSKCFPKWWTTYADVRETMRFALEEHPGGTVTVDYDQEEMALSVKEWLMSEHGNKLERCEVTREAEGFVLTLRAREEFCHARPEQAGDRPHAGEIDWEADD